MDETLLKVYFLPRIFKRLPEQDVFTTFYKTRRNSQLSLHFGSNLHSQLNICSSQNGITVLPIVKPEKSQSVHLYRNGRVILVENENVERGLYAQDRPEEGIFFSPTQPKV